MLDTAGPRLEVLFRGEGQLDGCPFTSCWNTEVVPGQRGTQRGIARGVLMLDSGEFVSWDEEGECWTEPSGLVVAEGTVVFTQHGTGPFEQLRGRRGTFRFEQDADLRYRHAMLLEDSSVSGEAEILAVLDEFTAALRARDTTRLMALFDDREDIVLVGSEEGESATGRSRVEATVGGILDRPVAYSFTWRDRRVQVVGSVAWVYADALINARDDAGEVSSVPYRLTAVLEQRGGRWLLRHYHGAEPAPHFAG